jgi:hypothetical protein
MLKSTIAGRTTLAGVGAISLCAMLAIAQPALGQSTVAIVVNGAQIQFDQPPVEQAGRVFVPLRGVFERLGATVVYDNGTINATGNGHAISLQVGSTQATVGGQTQTLDVAPFIVGSTTMVPLRFIAQALGATVNWNNNTSTVTIYATGNANNNGNRFSNYRDNNPTLRNQSFYLENEAPSNVAVNTEHPQISATYSAPVRNGSLRVFIDGRDISNDVYTKADGFAVTPSFPLAEGKHHVTVRGVTQDGTPFSFIWTFRTGV